MSELLARPSTSNHHDTDPANANFFNGFVHHGATSYDPYVSGFAFIKWLKVPDWVDSKANIPGTKAGDFAQMSQKNFKAFGGLSDIELETGGITSGFTGNELHYAKGIGNKPTSFSLKYQEQSGSPMTKYYNHWVSGIRDPRTGIATYAKEYGKEYHSNNHTGTLIYCVVRPDADNFQGGGTSASNLEFAAIYTQVQPKKIILSHFGYESNAHEMSEPEQEFSAYMNIGQAVEAFAASRLQNWFYSFVNEGSFSTLESVFLADAIR